jgi:hypothetical protein
VDPQQPSTGPGPSSGSDPANEWFWTGVPAGFILGVIGVILSLILGFWIGALIILVIVALGGRLAWRDGQESLVRYLAGTAILLIPAAIVYLVVIGPLIKG